MHAQSELAPTRAVATQALPAFTQAAVATARPIQLTGAGRLAVAAARLEAFRPPKLVGDITDASRLIGYDDRITEHRRNIAPQQSGQRDGDGFTPKPHAQEE